MSDRYDLGLCEGNILLFTKSMAMYHGRINGPLYTY